MANRRYVIIVAGGTGKRMGTEVPKQFLLLGGTPVLMHTLRAFFDYSDDIHITLVLNPDYIEYWDSLCQQYGCPIPHRTIAGGEQRFDSVKNGLDTLEGDGLVAIHDSVRPLVTHQLIGNSYSEASMHGSAIPVIPLNDTIREITPDYSRLIDRNNLYLIQTPQTFSLSLLKKAYSQPSSPAFTDDAAVFEAAGNKLNFIPGNPDNFKITYREDLHRAEKMIKQ